MISVCLVSESRGDGDLFLIPKLRDPNVLARVSWKTSVTSLHVKKHGLVGLARCGDRAKCRVWARRMFTHSMGRNRSSFVQACKFAARATRYNRHKPRLDAGPQKRSMHPGA